jgi:hypothetical protein
MKGVTMEPMDDAVRLAQRLRSLRTQRWPHIKVTQPMLGAALGGLSNALISSWESDTHPKVPPISRLEAYATLFCTERSAEGGKLRLLQEDELEREEQAERERLRGELLHLRALALGLGQEEELPAQGFWHFPDGKPIRIICAQLPPEMLARMPYVDPDEPDYVELYTYADVDALLELHGHIRAVNPASEVRVRKAGPGRLTADDYTAHVVLIGGVDWNPVTRSVMEHLDLPIRQRNEWGGEKGPCFEVGERRFYPELHDGELVADVALFYRGVSPLNRKRTLTICNGMYGRGTYGAVRALTHARFRDRNTEYLRARFAGTESFALLTKVPVFQRTVITPDWTDQEQRLHEWP